MKPSKKRASVWVVFHCEWMQSGRDPYIDEMVFHTRLQMTTVSEPGKTA